MKNPLWILSMCVFLCACVLSHHPKHNARDLPPKEFTSYDGTYTGRTTPNTQYSKKGTRCRTATIRVKILNSKVTGKAIDTKGYVYKITGFVKNDGRVFTEMITGGNTVVIMKGELSGDSGSGKWRTINNCSGTWHVCKE